MVKYLSKVTEIGSDRAETQTYFRLYARSSYEQNRIQNQISQKVDYTFSQKVLSLGEKMHSVFHLLKQ